LAQLDMSQEMLDALHRLSALLAAEDALEKTLQVVVELSVAVLPGCDAAGVTLRIEDKDRTAAASDEFTLEIDKLQYDAGEGPCVEALQRGETVFLEDISVEKRWPGFTQRAKERGLKSVLSQPLREDGTAGALNLYSNQQPGFDEQTMRLSEIFAKHASIAMKNARTYAAARRLSEQLTEALQSRDIIGQAKGILMEREGITDGEAFDLLKRISQHENVKLREIAERVVQEKNNNS
jgi:GAF domain-containing protein